MDRRTFLGTGAAVVAAAGILGIVETAQAASTESADSEIKPLPKPDLNSGKPLMTCLKERQANHSPGSAELDQATLGALLWSAWGVNREDGKRVIPTARNRQEAAVYAVLSDGVWEYLPKEHAIKRVLAGDQRARFDGAACILLFAAPEKDRFAAFHVGSMYQNVGLYCASAGLQNCVKAQLRDTLKGELPLPPEWAVLMTQSVGR